MHRLISSYLRISCFFVTLIFPFTISSQLLAAELSIPVELTEYGSYNIHADQAGLDETKTREAASYVKGYVFFKGQPLLSSLTVALGVSEPIGEFDLSALKSLCKSQDPRYKRIFAEATPPFFKIQSDGTIVESGKACEFYDLKAFTHVYTSEKALRTYRSLSTEHKKLMTAWRRGFQDAVRKESERFYQTFPELEPSKILQALETMNDRQLMSMVVAWETLYDVSSMERIFGGAATYKTTYRMGDNLPAPGDPSDSQGEESLKQKLNVPQEVKGVGASNSAAVVYKLNHNEKNSCIQAGQPHQPASERFKMPPLCVRFKDHSNKTVPVLQFGYANTAFYSPGSTSMHHATGGTADPVLPLEMFYTSTNGQQYFHRPTNTWHNFKTKSFQVENENGSFSSITRYEIEGFGEVYLLLKDPSTEEFFVISGRSRDADSAKTFFTEEEVAINGDAELFEQNLRENTAMFWGKTFCGPDDEGGQTAAMINYQGQIHDMKNWEDFNPVYINYILDEFLRGDRIANTYCGKGPWASSDNGPLQGGNSHDACPMAASLPTALDPGAENSRQRFVRAFSERLQSRDGITSRDELIEFGTSTYSHLSHALTAATSYAVQKFPSPTNTSEIFKGIAVALEGFDGKHRGDEPSLFVYILNEEYNQRKAYIAPAIKKFIDGSGEFSVTEAVNALDQNQAQIFREMLNSAINMYFQNCYAQGITRYSDAIRVVYEGQTLVEPGILKGPSPLGGARNTIHTLFDPARCLITGDGVSPLSHVYIDKKFKIYQFGTSASRNSFISSDVYDRSVAAWAEVLKKHNKDGKGYGGNDAHIEVCSFDPNTDPEQPMEILESFTVQLPGDLFRRVSQKRSKPIRKVLE